MNYGTGDPTPLNQTLIGTGDVVYGTCEVADLGFGTVIDSDVKLTGTDQNWEDCRGNTQFVLIRDQRYEYTATIFMDSGSMPAIGDSVEFPDVGVTGTITDASIKRNQADRRKITITGKCWLSLGSAPTVTQLTTG